MSLALSTAASERAPKEKRDGARLALFATAILACGAVAVLLATIVWLSFLRGAPGDGNVAYTLDNIAEMQHKGTRLLRHR